MNIIIDKFGVTRFEQVSFYMVGIAEVVGSNPPPAPLFTVR
jgi:hypothetical protein